ncbi:MAG TPA: DUF4388 domain-containing protein [Oculatellaceae cyanobacterium]
MFKKENLPVSRPPVRLPQPPSITEIGQIFSESMRQAGTRLFLSWPNSDRTNEFHLGVFFPDSSNEAYWEFFYGADRQKDPLWAYITSDVLLIYNLISSAMTSVEQKSAGWSQKKQNVDYKDLYMLPTAFYSSALDLMAESQKEQTGKAAPVSTSLGVDGAVAGSVLTGDLSQVDLVNVVQSISLARLTGKLDITVHSGTGEIHFEQGLPQQAKLGNTFGDEAFLQFFIHKQGSFHFEQNAPTQKRNIKQKLDELMLKSVLLRDKAEFLYNAGLRRNTILIRKHQNLAEAEFEKLSAQVASGSYLTFSMMAQKEFYLAIDDRSTISQIADKLRLTDSQWIPLLCRMLKADFVGLVNQEQEQMSLRPKPLDRNAIHAVMLSLRRPESGLYTFPAFAYFLEQEYLKARRSNRPMSLVILEARISGGNFEYRSPLPGPVLIELVRRISALKRDVDIVGHYEVFDIGIVLPDTNSQGAVVFAQRLLQSLREPPLSNIPETQISISAGIATAPEHVTDIELLIAAAEAAKNTAQHTAHGVALYTPPGAVQSIR